MHRPSLPMPHPSAAALPAGALLSTLLLLSASAAQTADLVVYDDALRNSFEDWSWATHSLTESGTRHSGTFAVSMRAKSWEGVFFHLAGGFSAAELDTLEFWVNGGSIVGADLGLVLQWNGSNRGSGIIDPYVEGGQVPTQGWARARVPLAALGVSGGQVDGIIFQAWSPADQGTLYLDDVALHGPGAPTGPISVTIDPAQDRRPIDERIYGVNLGTAADFAAAPYPLRRWGGNQTTRYSWQHDTVNSGMDWFFMNSPVDNPAPENLPNGGFVDRFVQETKAAGATPLVTLPTIGWTAKDRVKRWGYSVAKYGAQQDNECLRSGWQFWCAEDAGNGVRPNGSYITGNDPLDTSTAIGPTEVANWVQHLEGYAGGVEDYALDNELMLWHETHRDVHPAKVTYDELWARTLAYAPAIKAQDPSARLYGPVTWGWCDLFTSAADNCLNGADRTAHGGVPLVEWYLAQLGAYEQANGVRLVDVLDLHYYPQAPGVALSSDESPGTSAVRLRSLRELYDPSYVSESWIGQSVYLIPRAKAWIAAHAPWMKLAITEYNWGNDDGLSSTLAQAELLAIFGREGVDIATRWVAPEAGTRMVDAFRLYLNYDGAGARVEGESVHATSSDIDRVGAYAVRATGPQLFVLLFNKSTEPQSVSAGVGGGLVGPLWLYRFDGSQSLGPAGSITPSGGSFGLVLPPRSATLAVGARPASEVELPVALGSLGFEGARPNPLRPGDALHFALPTAGVVTLELFDAGGRRIRILARDRAFAAGPQSIAWDGRRDDASAASNGVYFARLTTGMARRLERSVLLIR
ncbi:MAG: hypothetical protein IPK72_00440 [Candidatus Eisenbacteria bacterium]|nr:hypothetical protein [Candidatus Eisenbacteria bacterium]